MGEKCAFRVCVYLCVSVRPLACASTAVAGVVMSTRHACEGEQGQGCVVAGTCAYELSTVSVFLAAIAIGFGTTAKQPRRGPSW